MNGHDRKGTEKNRKKIIRKYAGKKQKRKENKRNERIRT